MNRSIGLEAQDKEYPERLKRADRPETIGRFREETGIETIPKKIGEPDWYELGQFFREGFRQCVSHYLSELHEYSPPSKQDHDQAGCSLGPEVLVLSQGCEFQREWFLTAGYPISGVKRELLHPLNRINHLLAVNLGNISVPYDNPNIYLYDHVPPAGPLIFTVRLDNPHRRITLEPSGKEMEWNFAEGNLEFTVPRLELYDIIWIEEHMPVKNTQNIET